VKFDSMDDLIVQMDADVAAAHEVLGATPPQN
jgi:FAD synthase